MPSLDPAARAALLGPLLDCTCPTCHAVLVRHYCRSCDEFFTGCACPVSPEVKAHVEDHRIYLWTPAGVLAIPDFDTFPR